MRNAVLGLSLCALILAYTVCDTADAERQSLAKKKKKKEQLPAFCPQRPSNSNARNYVQKDSVHFVVFGDQGTGKNGQKRVADGMYAYCQVNPCDFFVSTGDNFYSSGVHSTDDPMFKTHFEDVYGQFGDKDFWMTCGNHDRGMPKKLNALGAFAFSNNQKYQVSYSQACNARFQFPAPHYLASTPDWMKIYVTDTNLLTNKQRTTIEQSIGCGDNSVKWRFLVGHAPFRNFGNGHGDSEGGSEPTYLGNRILYKAGVKAESGRRKSTLPMMKKCDINFVISGHDHHMEHIKEVDEGKLWHQFILGNAGKNAGVHCQDQSGGDTSGELPTQEGAEASGESASGEDDSADDTDVDSLHQFHASVSNHYGFASFKVTKDEMVVTYFQVRRYDKNGNDLDESYVPSSSGSSGSEDESGDTSGGSGGSSAYEKIYEITLQPDGKVVKMEPATEPSDCPHLDGVQKKEKSKSKSKKKDK